MMIWDLRLLNAVLQDKLSVNILYATIELYKTMDLDKLGYIDVYCAEVGDY